MNIVNTIAAISTPQGVGGISIIRLSGDDAITIADKIFFGKNKLKNVQTHTINYGHIKDDSGDIIDEVLVSVMHAPHTYTGENVVEINCHGGLLVVRKVLSVVLNAGAVMAQAGEFTKRAFLNGRIDLTKAESVIDIINSKTNLSHSVAINQLSGKLSNEINSIREKILTLISHVQVLLDFPEEDLAPLSDDEFIQSLWHIKEDITRLLNGANQGKIIRDGIDTVIVGKPNVGKSSLLNLLAGEEKAIVTPIAGTTRDAIEEYVTLGGIALKIIDTAGLHTTDDIIENMGVEKTKKLMEKAALVLFMTDAQKELDDDDISIINAVKNKNTIAIVNKSEHGIKTDIGLLKTTFDYVIPFSVIENTGVDALSDAINQMFELRNIESIDTALITNIRQEDALKKAKRSIESALLTVESGMSVDMTFIDIENAISHLGEITGLTVGEEIVDKIFHNFCIGK